MKAWAKALLLACAVASATTARAVPVGPPIVAPQLVFPGEPIPVNGALALHATDCCSFAAAASLIVEVTAVDAPDVAITASEITDAGGYTVWRGPLVAGTTYDVMTTFMGNFTAAPPVAHGTFTAVDEALIELPAIEPIATLEHIEVPAGQVCCSVLFSGASGNCFTTAFRTEAELRVELTTGAPPELANQFVYRIDSELDPFVVEAAVDGYAPMSTPFSLHFREPADEYCFELRAVRLIDAAEYSDVPVATRCVPHDETVPRTREVPLDNGFLDHVVCVMPPQELKAEWCALNEAPCTVPSPPESCLGYGYACLGEPYPEYPEPDAGSMTAGNASVVGGTGCVGGETGSAGGAQAGSAGASGIESDEAGGTRAVGAPDGASDSERGNGCNAIGRSSPQRGSGLAFAILALVLSFRRPCRRTRSRAAR